MPHRSPPVAPPSTYQEHAPPPALRPFVACLRTRRATADTPASSTPVRVLPDGCVDVPLAVRGTRAPATAVGIMTRATLVPAAPGAAPQIVAPARGARRGLAPRTRTTMLAGTVRKLTPVLIVDAIEPVLPFWVERLGFTVVAEVPHHDALGFVILVRDGVELMYQSRASVAEDAPAALPTGEPTRDAMSLFFEVSDLDAVATAVAGLDLVVPRRRTFYGTDEIGVREPGGRVVMFAQPVAAGSGVTTDVPDDVRAVEPTGT